MKALRGVRGIAIAGILAAGTWMLCRTQGNVGEATTTVANHHDRSGRLAPRLDADEDAVDPVDRDATTQQAPRDAAPIVPPVITAAEGSAAIEQTASGTKPGPALVESFEGMGAGFSGPQGEFRGRNPSDNSLYDS